MRKQVTIVGVGNRRAGVSKAGKKYDFTPISFEFEDLEMTGFRAETVDATADALGDYVPQCGDKVVAVFHYSNYRPYLDVIFE